MSNTKRSAAVTKIEKGIHKEKHLNQYGDQNKQDAQKVRDQSEKVNPEASTISGRDNAVQKNAREDAKEKAQN